MVTDQQWGMSQEFGKAGYNKRNYIEQCNGADWRFRMNQIDRITRMEEYLNNALKAVEHLEKALDEYLKVEPDIEELLEYYGSPIWFKDVDDDDQGLLPEGLRRGVLSEDGIYNMLYDNTFLLQKMQALLESRKK